MKTYLPVISRDLSQKIRITSILYLQQETRYVRVVTDKTEIVFRGKLAEIAKMLSASFDFCHSYLLINLERVEKMYDAHIYFDDGRKLRVGRGSFAAFRKQFNEYLRSLT